LKRVLLDHCVPRRVRTALTAHDVFTTFEQGWSQLKNGQLLSAAEGNGFDVFVTCDKNLKYQQNLVTRKIAIVVLPTNTLSSLLPLFGEIAEAVKKISAGGFEELSA
jgi:hypothetical protein